MKKMKAHVSEATQEARSNFKELARNNGNLITGFITILVLVAGAGLVQGRSTWWLSGLTIFIGFTLLFFFLNARVFIKFLIATLSALFSASLATQIGNLMAPTQSIGLLWMTSILGLYFGALTISYMFNGHRSRWTGLTLALWFNFFATITFTSGLQTAFGVSLSLALSLILFLMYYRGTGVLMERRKLMPEDADNSAVEEALVAHAEHENWEIRRLPIKRRFKDTGKANYLIWNDSKAFVIKPVKLASKLAISPGRKSSKLSHRGVSINPWLLNSINRDLPLWRARNASMMLVLWDVANVNGSKPEAIGVSLPDTKKKIPVGIFPGKSALNRTKKSIGVFDALVDTYGDYLGELSEKQKRAMGEINVIEGSSYLDSDEDS